MTAALLLALVGQCDNVALGATVSASGTAYDSCPPEQAVDGIVDSSCGWAGRGLQDLVVDLGQSYTIDHTLVGPFNAGTTTFYSGEWTLTHSHDGSTWIDFEGVTKVRGAGDLGTTGISITNGDPGTGAADPAYKYYEFTVTPVELRYARISTLVGDVDDDSNIDEVELCAVSGTADGGGGVNDYVGAREAGCEASEYYDLIAGECRAPTESCAAAAAPPGVICVWLLTRCRRRR